MKMIKTALFASTVVLASASAGFAAPVVGLTGDKTLVMFDTESPAVTESMEVTGVDSLVGIDLRPANNTLIGVTADNVIVTIDLESGEATELATMNTPLEMGDGQVVVDFNPMADRLRYMTGTTNHRVHPDTGEVTVDGSLAFEEGDANASAAPMTQAAAYINSFGTPEATGMYNIDTGLSALVQQTAPNDGTLATIGELGVELSGPVAFDVQTTEDGTNTAWLVAGGALHTVDLETGAATLVGEITGADGDIRDIAVLPAM
jgi:hypothetical protein